MFPVDMIVSSYILAWVSAPGGSAMPLFRTQIATVLAGILFAGTGAVLSAASRKSGLPEPKPEPVEKPQPPPRW